MANRRLTDKKAIKLDATGTRLLIVLHTGFVLAWIAAAVTRNVVLLATANPSSSEALYTGSLILMRVEELLIIPATAGVLVTAFLMSALTDWGFFKSRPIAMSWIVTVGLLILSIACLGPWTIRLVGIASTQGLLALHDPTYGYYRTMLFAAGSAQLVALILMASAKKQFMPPALTKSAYLWKPEPAWKA